LFEEEKEKASDVFLELPSTKKGPKALRALAVQCREKLSLIQNATYLCQSQEGLVELDVMLNEAFTFINTKLYKDSGVSLEEENQQSSEKGKWKRNSDPIEGKNNKCVNMVIDDRGKKKGSKKRKHSLKLPKTKEEEQAEVVVVEGHEAVPRTVQEQLKGTLTLH
jgi:hypothetical protein